MTCRCAASSSRSSEGAKARIFALNTAAELRPHRARSEPRRRRRFRARTAPTSAPASRPTRSSPPSSTSATAAARARSSARCSTARRPAPISARSRSRAARSRPTPSSRSRPCCSTAARPPTAKPELEIFADDVKCAHGATVGELDAMQLFYAESRGLDPASARALLLEGFVMGLWDSAKDGDAICAAAARCAAEGRVNAPTRINSALNVRDQFPAIAGWHYLDSAATAQKPQAVIDAITAGLFARLRDRASRRVRTLGDDDRELRGCARRRVEPDRRPAQRTDLHARRDRGDQSRRADAAEGRPQPRPALAARASQQHRPVAARRLRSRRRAADRRRPDRSRRGRSDADRRASRRRLRACVERARLGPRREARRRDRAFEGRAAAARRLPGGAAHAGRRRRDRRRFLRFLRRTSSTARPASAACGAAPTCSPRCRRGRAAAR